MGKTTKYVARKPDASGAIRYTDAEHAIWAELYARQRAAIDGAACDEFIHGFELLNLPRDRVPQLGEVSKVLKRETGWELAPVPALIPFDEFFELLAARRFPAATFVRRREELDYLEEPDIFHELFGHTPLLTNPYFAEFTHTYGRLGRAASEEERVFLARMYWFTVEFGLMRKPGADLRIYGGGILSSIGETGYVLRSDKPQRRRFDLLDALRTPYRIDIMQPLYYVIEDLRELYDLTRIDLMAKVDEARRLGLFAPLFPPKAGIIDKDGPPKPGMDEKSPPPKQQAA
jgi:phenylalanine-4-hydroxylase